MQDSAAFTELMALRTGESPTEILGLIGADPILPTRFRLGESAAAIHLAIGIAVNDLWQIRTGNRQDLSIDVRHAAATLKSFEYFGRIAKLVRQPGVSEI